MVYFSCGACGQSLKKNQVEKHYQMSCFDCNVLSCLDCHKEFFGEEYQKHITCITEEEKYCGKAYVPKVNKGVAKQEEWIRKITEIMEETYIKPELRILLGQIRNYSNIPRKQNKFEKFVKNSFPYVRPDLIPSAWEIFAKAQAKPEASPAQNGKPPQPEKRKAEDPEIPEVKKKSKKSKEPATEETNEGENKKFDWELNISEILEKKGEMSLMKLQKKILARYYKHYELDDTSKEEKLVAKLQRKISDESKYKLSPEGRVSLHIK